MADDKLKNFIPISRRIFTHELWEEKREFSKFEAWVDLIQTARFDKEIRSEWINSKEVKFGRGQLIGSVRFLQKRWNWGSITKVERYLKVLENKDMVVLEKGQGVSVITICKYDDYNKEIKDERTVKGQGKGQQKDKTNTVNKVNNSLYDKTLDDYKEMRSKKKASLTQRGLELIEDKLNKLSNGVEDVKIKILNQSIENSWTGVFELNKQQELFNKKSNTVEATEDMF